MSSALKEMDKAELVNLERLTHLLKGLSPAELETLEILLDEDACETIAQSLKELEEGRGIPIDEW
jgi:DNA replication protein DnaD